MDLQFYKDKKVLVTGHTGFKGSWLCRILVNAGAEVTGYSLEPPTEPNLFSMCGAEDQMNSIIGDIRDREHLSKVFEEVQDVYKRQVFQKRLSGIGDDQKLLLRNDGICHYRDIRGGLSVG